MAELSPFHLSLAVTSIAAARKFYGDLLGCSEGRSDDKKIYFNFFGHHLVLHAAPREALQPTELLPPDEGITTPIQHFGIMVTKNTFEDLAKRLTAAKADFLTTPRETDKNTVKEQSIMHLNDGCGNIIEFKYQEPRLHFAKRL